MTCGIRAALCVLCRRAAGRGGMFGRIDTWVWVARGCGGIELCWLDVGVSDRLCLTGQTTCDRHVPEQRGQLSLLRLRIKPLSLRLHLQDIDQRRHRIRRRRGIRRRLRLCRKGLVRRGWCGHSCCCGGGKGRVLRQRRRRRHTGVGLACGVVFLQMTFEQVHERLGVWAERIAVHRGRWERGWPGGTEDEGRQNGSISPWTTFAG